LLIGNIDAKILTAKKGSNIRGKIIAVNLTVEPGASLDGQIKAAAQDSSATATAAVEGKGPGDKAGDSHKNNKS
jgi:cytoskeletal protein CcmA (bactofilin family)